MTLLLRNTRLIPELSAGYDSNNADMLIRDGLIAEIAEPGRINRVDEEIDCHGMTALPGLFDMHMHINWSYLLGELGLTDFKLLTQSCLSARHYLDCGITTVRDMGSAKRVAIAVRNAISLGLTRGPRILAAGLIIAPVRRSGKIDEYHFLREVSGADEMLLAARQEIGDGADWIKLYVNGNPPDMLEEEIKTAIETAHSLDKRVAAHAHYTRSINRCLDMGVDTIEHGTYLDSYSLAKLKEGVSRLVPTLSVFSPGILSPGDTPETKKLDAPMFEGAIESVKAAYHAGFPLALGTDTPIETLMKKQNMGLEMRIRKELCGMRNIDILLQATRYSAEAAGIAEVTGELREGLSADVILVDGRPDEDISVMYGAPKLVIANGEPYMPR